MRDVLGKLLDFLGQYVVRHFAEEEKLMEEWDCPIASANMQAHAQFLSTFSGLKKQFDENGNGSVLVLQIHDLLSKWLIQHISRIDVQLREMSRSRAEEPCRGDELSESKLAHNVNVYKKLRMAQRDGFAATCGNAL